MATMLSEMLRSRLLLVISLCLFWWMKLAESLMMKLETDVEECLLFDVPPNDQVSGSFDFLPENVWRVTFRIMKTETRQNVTSIDHQSKGRFSFHTNSTSGPIDSISPREYQMCVGNQEGFPVTLSFSFRTGDASTEVATGDKTEKLADIVGDINENLREMDYQQEYSSRRVEAHRQTAESTNRRVVIWTSVKVLVIAVLLFIQVYYFRGYFEVKSVV